MTAACIFTATKVEEAPRRLRDIVNVLHHLKQTWNHSSIQPMDLFGRHYLDLKNEIIKYERYLLKELGFCVHVKHPHKMIMSILNVLGKGENVALIQRAWNLMNDSLRTSVLIQYPPEVVACGCIFLAARLLKVSLPESPGWWEMFDASRRQCEEVALDVLEVYQWRRRGLESVERDLKEVERERSGKLLQLKTSAAISNSTTCSGGGGGDREGLVAVAVSVPASTETSPKVSPVARVDLGSDRILSAGEDDSAGLKPSMIKIPSRGPSPLLAARSSQKEAEQEEGRGGSNHRHRHQDSHRLSAPQRLERPAGGRGGDGDGAAGNRRKASAVSHHHQVDSQSSSQRRRHNSRSGGESGGGGRGGGGGEESESSRSSAVSSEERYHPIIISPIRISPPPLADNDSRGSSTDRYRPNGNHLSREDGRHLRREDSDSRERDSHRSRHKSKYHQHHHHHRHRHHHHDDRSSSRHRRSRSRSRDRSRKHTGH